MFRSRFVLSTAICCLLGAAVAPADEPSHDPAAAERADWIETLYPRVRESVVTVRQIAESGEESALGAGFVIDGGMIATCFHVIGEGQRLAVEWRDGTSSPVTEIVAWDEVNDLAVLRPLPEEAAPPTALALGEDSPLAAGAAVLAVGSPHGWRGSVAGGVASGEREVGERSLLQVALPVEHGNSGGPVVDAAGRVRGVVTLKSSTDAGVGFAVPVRDLRALLARRMTPVSMDRWLGFSALDTAAWEPVFDGHWKMRGGAVSATCCGEAGTGRTLCLRRGMKCEAAGALGAWLRFASASGGAGLAFGVVEDGAHFGLFLSERQLWLARFAGSDPAQWTVLAQASADGWTDGQWNELRLTFTAQDWTGWLNGQPILHAPAATELAASRFGLLKLGRAHVDFRELSLHGGASAVPPASDATLPARVAALPEPSLADLPEADLEAAALGLKRRLAEVREMAAAARLRRHEVALAEALSVPRVDPTRAAFCLGALADWQTPVEPFRQPWERACARLAAARPRDPSAGLKAARAILFEEFGLRGPVDERVEPADHLPQLAFGSRRASVELLRCLWLSLADAAGLPLVPLAAREHLGWEPARPGEGWRLLDVRTGELLPEADSAQRLAGCTGRCACDRAQERRSRHEAFTDLLRAYVHASFARGAVPWAALDAFIAHGPEVGHERFIRAVLRLRDGDREGWQEDWDWLRENDADYTRSDRAKQVLTSASAHVAAWQQGLPPHAAAFHFIDSTTNHQPPASP